MDQPPRTLSAATTNWRIESLRNTIMLARNVSRSESGVPLRGLRMNSPTVDRRAVLKRRKCRGKLNQPSPAKDAVVECPRIPALQIPSALLYFPPLKLTGSTAKGGSLCKRQSHVIHNPSRASQRGSFFYDLYRQWRIKNLTNKDKHIV